MVSENHGQASSTFLSGNANGKDQIIEAVIFEQWKTEKD